MDGSGLSVSEACSDEAAFAAIVEAWFQLLACGGSSADVAATPSGRSGAPSMLDLLAGVTLSDGVLGAYTPSPLQEPTHLEGHAADWAGFDSRPGGGRPPRLSREEWGLLLSAGREAWGMSSFLRKALASVGPRGSSLLAGIVLGQRGGGLGPPAAANTARAAAAIQLLRASGQLHKARGELHAFLRRSLPDGEAISNSLALEELLLAHETCRGKPQPAAATTTAVVPRTVEEPRASSASSTARASAPAQPRSSPTSSTVPPLMPEVAPSSSSSAVPRFCQKVDPSSSPSASATSAPLSQVPAALLADPCRRVGADVSEGLLVTPCESATGLRRRADGGLQCCICLEDFAASRLRHCGRAACGKSAYCLDCLRQHAESVVHGGLYAAPAVRCPCCNVRLGTEAWASLVADATLVKYRENARALLNYRCAACDESNSYFNASGGGRDPFASLDCEVRERIGEAWRRFFLAETTAEDFLQVVLDEYSCGHRHGGCPPAKLAKVFGPSGGVPWIADMERRLAVQLAWLHRFPKQRTPCCGERFCFRCKVSSWHRGISCEERLQAEKARQAQLCPGCGVPTQRSEGCRKITCVCGRVWEWEGDDSSEEGTFSDEGSEAEAAQAQTPVNLVAMNTRASEDSVSTVIQALVNARADVNQSTAPASEAPHPLLLAVQCRHAAAVGALCEHGSRVSNEVLEEVKLISHETKRARINELLRPQIQGDPNMKLPLWVWVQAGSLPAVEALLRNSSHEESVGADVLITLNRTRGDEDMRKGMTARIREHVGEARYRQLQLTAATRMLLLELRQAHDEERDVEVEIVKEALANGADANAREESHEDELEAADGGYGLTALSLVAMNSRASPVSISACVEALLEAKADVNAEADEASSPLLAALQHRHVAAVEALCKGPVKLTGEILDEVKTISEPSRRGRVQELLRPIIQASTGRRLPLWLWVQDGATVAVEALLRSSSAQVEELVDIDTFVAFQRLGSDAAGRRHIQDQLRIRLGPQEFDRQMAVAASRRLLQELREAYEDRRDVSLEVIRSTLAQGADANAQEEEDGDAFEDDVGGFALSALQLLVTNTHSPSETMLQAVQCLVDAKADVNLDLSDSALLLAVQHRCVSGIEALSKHGAKVSPEVLEELKSVSGSEARDKIVGFLQPLVESDKTLRCPLWIWVQFGCPPAVEALLRNVSHDEEVDVDVMVALQRCRGSEDTKRQITDHLKEQLGEEEFHRLEAAAATRRLLLELREAYSEEREPDLEVVCDCLALGANPNAREEDPLDDHEEDDELDDDDDDGDEDEEDDDDEDDATRRFGTDSEDDREDGFEDLGEPEEELGEGDPP